MNIHDLRQAQVRFENGMEQTIEARKELHQLRASFVKFFSRKRISIMGIDDYVAGVDLPKTGYNFCYTLERELDGLGRISGSPAPKFGVYYGKRGKKTEDDYQFVRKFGETYQEAFEGVRQSLLKLIDAGESENIQAITGNLISPMVKGKILCTYFPDRYLNIFSPDHLDYFLIQLDLDTERLIGEDPVVKREALIEFKNQDPVMKNWTVDLFSHFLYTEYPGRPPKEGETTNTTSDPLAAYRNPNFPANPVAEFIELNILPPNLTNSAAHNRVARGRGKPDYESEARELKKLGDRGEKVVMDLEIKTLQEAGRKDLAKKVERVSLKSDSFGYDILSFETDGTEKYIEVKATRAKVGSANFFFTANELREAKESKNYFIYMIYDVVTKSPKVWAIKNPFNPENINTVMTPINFRISINATNV
jgi:hypothetical protein